MAHILDDTNPACPHFRPDKGPSNIGAITAYTDFRPVKCSMCKWAIMDSGTFRPASDQWAIWHIFCPINFRPATSPGYVLAQRRPDLNFDLLTARVVNGPYKARDLFRMLMGL
jgi:hypothetical protein